MAHGRKPLDYYLSLRYPVTLVPEEEGGYTAIVPDLPGCVTVGETAEEAMAMAEDAKRLWIEDAYESGEVIPVPSTEREYSGRLLLRMPKSLHRRLAEDAEREGISLNQYVVALLQERSVLKRLEHKFEATIEQFSKGGSRTWSPREAPSVQYRLDRAKGPWPKKLVRGGGHAKDAQAI